MENKGCTVLHTIDAGARLFHAIGIIAFDTASLYCSARLRAFPNRETLVDPRRYGDCCQIENMEVHQISRNGVEECQFSMSEISLRKQDRDNAGRDVKIDLLPAGTATGVRIKFRGEYIDKDAFLTDAKYKKDLEYLRDVRDEMLVEIDVTRANVAYAHLNCAVWLALRICEPSSFVVEQTHVDFKPREPKAGKVIRSPYRPHYIVLTPGEIRRRFIRDDEGEAVPSGLTRRPHERRGHFRRLTSEKFVSKRGQVLWIKPCWVGKTEGVIGKNRYVVRLDL